MAKQIKTVDFIQPNVLSPVREEFEKTIIIADKLDKSLIDVADTFDKLIKASSKSSLSGINQFIAASKELNTITDQTISKEKEKLTLQTKIEKQRLEEIRLQKAREKSIDDYNEKIRKQAQAEKSAFESFNKELSKKSAAEEKAQSAREIRYNKDIEKASKSASIQQKINEKQEQEKIRQSTIAYEKFQNQLHKKSALELKSTEKTSREALKREAQYNKEIAAAEKLNQPYNKLSATLNRLRGEYKNLAAAGRENEKEAKDLAQQIGLLDAKLKGIDASTGQFQRSVGNYEKGLGRLKFSFRDIINVAGQFGLALGGIQIAKGAIETLKNFDEGAADIAKTVGITTEEARKLSRSLLEIDTKTSISELQQIAAIGGQLVDTTAEVEDFTKSVDKLNVALSDEFSGGAEEVTRTIGGLRNVFTDIKSDKVGEDILHIGNALNELGAAGSATSPVISDFSGRIGGIGIPLGLSTSQVLGLSTTLQELNINAERGGTATAKIFQSMGKNSVEFAKLAGVPLKEFEHLVNTDIYGAFQQVVKGSKQFEGNAVGLSKQLDKLGLDGAGASEVFLKLSGNMDLLEKRTILAGEALGKTDSITEEFNTKNNTLGANLDKLGNKWDAFVIGADSATGATSALSNIVGTIANNIPLLIGLIVKVGAAWVSYRIIQGAVNTDFKELGKNIFSLRKPMSDLNGEVQKGTGALTGLGSAIKGMIITAAITFLIEMGAELYNIASGAKQAEEDLARMNKQVQISGDRANSRVSERRKAVEQYKKDLETLRADEKISDQEFNRRVKASEEEFQKKTNQDITAAKARKKREEDELKSLLVLRSKMGVGYDIAKFAFDAAQSANGVIGIESTDQLEDRIAHLKANSKGINESIKIYTTSLEESANATHGLDIENKNLNKSTRDLSKEEKKAAEERLNILADYRRRAEDIEDELINDEQEREEVQLRRRLDRELEGIEITGKEAKRLRDDLQAKYNDDILKIQDEFNERRLAKEVEYWENVRAAQEASAAEDKRIQEELLAQELDLIENSDKQKELSLLESSRTEEDINAESSENLRKSLEQRIKILEAYGQDATDLKIQLAKLDRDIDKETADLEKKRIQELAEFRKKTISDALDELRKESEEREKLLDKRISDEQRFQDKLQEAANAGNIQAQQSIAASEASEQKATIAKQEEAEQQKRLDDLKVFYQLVESNLEKAKADNTSPLAAIAKAIAQTGIVKGAAKLISGIPGFFTGTKGRLKDEMSPNINTGSDPDNRLVRLSGDEGVFTGDKMNRLASAGLKTTDDITDSALMFQRMNMGEMNMGARVIVAKKSPDKTERYLKQLVDIMDSKEDFRLDPIFVRGIVVGAVASSKKGNIEKYNKFIPRS